MTGPKWPGTGSWSGWPRAGGWRRWAKAGSAALVFVLTWPIPTLTPASGLDPSWQAGLHLAAQRGLDFGHDITFTYGPLGFLGSPRLFFTSTAVLGVLYTVAVHAALCITVVYLANKVLPWPLAAAGAYIVISLAVVEPAEMVPIVLSLWCLRAVGRARRQEDGMPWWPWILGTAVAAVQLLLKFNTGVFCVALLVVTAALILPKAWRLPAVLVAEFVALVVGLWLLTGGALSHLPDFVRHSLDMTSGYSAAMALEEPARHWEYIAAPLLLAFTVGAVVFASRRWRLRRDPLDRTTRAPAFGVVPVLIVIAIVGYLEFRRGFVRHDGHSVPFFFAGALLPLAIPWSKRAAYLGLGVVVAWVIVLGFATVPAPRILLNPRPRLTALADQADAMLTSHNRDRALLAAKAKVRSEVNLGPAVLAEVDGHTVHIDPAETSAIWAYGLDWLPEPVFQSYLAYTPALDQENADLLASSRGPERVIRHVPLQAIDGRHVLMDDPRSEVALACNYYEAVLEGQWEVLRKGPDRCLPARPLEPVKVKNGERVAVPNVGDNELLVMRVHLGTSLLGQLRAGLFKPAGFDYVVLDGGSFRLVTANAEGPLLLCLPPATGYSPPVSSPCPTTVSIVHAGEITIDFSAIPLRTEPTPA